MHITDKYHIDILTAHFVMNPDRFDVVVASNLFGDILSDLGPACTGTIGIAPSANINPERNFPSLFEPVHGSAPGYLRPLNIANPIGMIWSGAMMLDHLGEDCGFGRHHDRDRGSVRDRPSYTGYERLTRTHKRLAKRLLRRSLNRQSGRYSSFQPKHDIEAH